MTLPEFIDILDKRNQIKLATELIEIGLPVWNEYVDKNPIEYTDSVIAMHHKIDNRLIDKVIEISKDINTHMRFVTKIIYKSRLKELYDEIREPIVALQDNDFEIPLNVELILLSAYNLTEYLNGKRESSFKENLAYISINQSIDSITKSGILNFDDTNRILKKYKKMQSENE